MVTPAFAAAWFLPFATPIALWIAWSDMRAMRIPNQAVLLLVLVFLFVGPFVLSFEDWAWRWTHLLVVLVAGFILNVIGQTGAGDAKYAAAMAPMIAQEDLISVMILVAGTLPAALVTHRLFGAVPAIRRLTPDWASWGKKDDFPFGLALSGILLLYLVLSVKY